MRVSNPNLTSKKRTRQSSFTCMFTRNKSQLYLHRNRSGRTRSDSSRNREMHLNPPDYIAKRPRKISENTDDDWTRVLIRDLRTRRVFSPAASIQNDSEKDGFGGVVISDILCVKDDVNVRENGGIMEPKKGDLNVNAENVKDEMVVVEGFQNGFGGLEEENLQSTPPNMEIFGCSIVENEREMASNLNPNLNAGKNGVFSGKDDKKNGNALGNKFILNPCSRSRVRVFKAPGSFSYRRLLPILVDMARESSHCPVAKKQSDISAHLSTKPTIEEESEKDDNLQNMSPGCLLQWENLMPDGADEPIPTYDKEAEKINVESSCIAEFRSDTVQERSLNSEKDLQNGDEEPRKHDFDEAVELTINAGVNNSSNTITGNAIQSSNQLPQNPADKIVLSNNAGQDVKFAASNFKSKLGLSPCAKLKRFKTPRSFSYKRMLPFLMEITKDESEVVLPGDSGNTHSWDSREVNQSFTLSSDIHGIPYGKQNTDTATNDASDSNCLSVNSTEEVNKPSLSFNSQEEELAAKNAGAEKEKKNLSAVVWSGYTPSVEHPQCEKGVAVNGISQNPSLVYGSDPLRTADCSRKSILKRNPRGCRGLCTCLNCASFRLHAERAFEFSKNQVQDAEEIALNLVRQLSQLRNILEKTATSDANSDVICSNQVKEACKKASEIEELAKARVMAMIYDLNVHCRIPCSQPPRVTFAIDEGLISRAVQSKSEEKTIN